MNLLRKYYEAEDRQGGGEIKLKQLKIEFSVESIRDFVKKDYPSVAARCTKSMLAHYDNDLAALQEENRKLRETLEQIDKSLYIGEDLMEEEILKWYIDVVTVIKDEIKQLLSK